MGHPPAPPTFVPRSARPPLTPLDRGPLECHPAVPHGDVGDGYMDNFANHACKDEFRKMDWFSPKVVAMFNFKDGLGVDDGHYMYAYTAWLPGCETEIDVMDAQAPLKDVGCRDVVYGLWEKCKSRLFSIPFAFFKSSPIPPYPPLCFSRTAKKGESGATEFLRFGVDLNQVTDDALPLRL